MKRHWTVWALFLSFGFVFNDFAKASSITCIDQAITSTSPIEYWSVTKNGKWLIYLTIHRDLHVRNLFTQKEVVLQKKAKFRISHQEKKLMSATADGLVEIYDLETQTVYDLNTKAMNSFAHRDWVSEMQFSKSDDKVITASTDGTGAIYDLQTGELSRHFFLGTPVSRAGFFDDSNSAYFITLKGSLRIVSLNELSRFRAEPNHEFNLESVYHWTEPVFIDSGKKMIYFDHLAEEQTSKHMLVRIYDFETHLSQMLSFPEFYEFAVDQKTKQIAVGMMDGKVQTFVLKNIEFGQGFRKTYRHRTYAHYLSFVQNGEKLFSASSDHSAKILDLNSGEIKNFLMKDSIMGVEASQSGDKVVITSFAGEILVHDLVNGKTTTLDAKSGITQAYFSRDSKTLFTSAIDGVVRVFDLENEKSIAVPDQATTAIYEIPTNEAPLATRRKDGGLQLTCHLARLKEENGSAETQLTQTESSPSQVFSNSSLSKEKLLNPSIRPSRLIKKSPRKSTDPKYFEEKIVSSERFTANRYFRAEKSGSLQSFYWDTVSYSGRHRIVYYLPKSFWSIPPGKRKMLVFLHGGGGSTTDLDSAFRMALRYYDDWAAYAETRSVALMMPISSIGWNEYSVRYLPEELLPVAREELALDGNSIYLAGHSMGAMGISRVVPRIVNFYAGIAAYNGAMMPKYQTSFQLLPLLNTRFLMVNSTGEDRSDWVQWMRSLSGNMQTLEEKYGTDKSFQEVLLAGSHSPEQEKYNELMDELLLHSRNIYSKKVFGLWSVRKSDFKNPPGLSLFQQNFWLELRKGYPEKKKANEVRPYQVFGSIDKNHVQIETREKNDAPILGQGPIQKIRIYLSSRTVDFSRPIRVSYNGVEKFNKTLKVDFTKTIQAIREKKDSSFYFESYLDLKL